MRVDPAPAKRLRLPTRIHLLVEKVGDRFITKCDGDSGAVLFH